MLPFLAYPKQFTDHFYTRSELAYLRHQRQGQRIFWLNYVALVIGLVFSLSFVKDLWQLLLLGILVALAQLILYVRTLTYACDLMTRERRLDIWDSLVLTSLDAERIVIGKWWAVLRHVRSEYILVTLLRLTMAVALSQYLFYIPTLQCPKVLGALCYQDVAYNATLPYSENMFPYRSRNWYGSNALPEYYANLETIYKVALAAAVLVAFSVLEAGLVTALGLLISLLLHTHLHILIAFAVRLSLIALAVVIAGTVGFYRDKIVTQRLGYMGSPNTQYSYDNSFCHDICIQVQASEAFQAVVSSLAEDGLSIASNLLRPKLLMSRSIYLLRNLSWAVAGLGIYVLLLWLCLRATLRAAIHHRALQSTFH